jgi:hypothetical protein
MNENSNSNSGYSSGYSSSDEQLPPLEPIPNSGNHADHFTSNYEEIYNNNDHVWDTFLDDYPIPIPIPIPSSPQTEYESSSPDTSIDNHNYQEVIFIPSSPQTEYESSSSSDTSSESSSNSSDTSSESSSNSSDTSIESIVDDDGYEYYYCDDVDCGPELTNTVTVTNYDSEYNFCTTLLICGMVGGCIVAGASYFN